MDPGNWATDLAGGAQFGYTLLSVVMISNLMAILLQHLRIKLGVVTGRDLAQACRDHYSTPTVWFLWWSAKWPSPRATWPKSSARPSPCNCSSAFRWSGAASSLRSTCSLVLYLQNKGFRYIEARGDTLIATIGSLLRGGAVFLQAQPQPACSGFRSRHGDLTNPGMLYVAIGIIGATVMPHNLYLHSSIVQTRKFEQTPAGKREAIKFATIDSTIALMFALFINAAILDPRGRRFSLVGPPGCGGDPGRL